MPAAAQSCLLPGSASRKGSHIWAGYDASLVVISAARQGVLMTEPSLPELEAERDRLYEQLAGVGDFRRGSVSENYRKCGKPNCACAAPDHRGHGPRLLWTRSAAARKTIGRQLAAAEGEKVRRGPARRRGVPARRRPDAAGDEQNCQAQPAGGSEGPAAAEGEKGGSG